MAEKLDSSGVPEFEKISVQTEPSERAKQEAAEFAKPPNDFPANSVNLNFGQWCNISWHAESSAPLFCFFSIIVLLFFGIVLALIAVVNSSMTWPAEAFKFLGQAILTLVGAVVGASAVGGSSARSRKNGSRS
jgi:hypothetical protein